jgi:hypothetical protein
VITAGGFGLSLAAIKNMAAPIVLRSGHWAIDGETAAKKEAVLFQYIITTPRVMIQLSFHFHIQQVIMMI